MYMRMRKFFLSNSNYLLRILMYTQYAIAIGIIACLFVNIYWLHATSLFSFRLVFLCCLLFLFVKFLEGLQQPDCRKSRTLPPRQNGVRRKIADWSRTKAIRKADEVGLTTSTQLKLVCFIYLINTFYE